MKLKGKIVALDLTLAEESAEKLFRKGIRVISIAVKDVIKKADYSINEENNLTLLGFLCFKDPLKSM